MGSNNLFLRRARRVLTAVLALLGLLMVAVTTTPLVPRWARALAGPWDDPAGDIMIVLAGASLEDGILAESSYWRAVYAVRAWREGGFREVVIAGGSPEGPPPAQAMRQFLIAEGVPIASIRVETASHSTRENALNVTRMLAQTPGGKVLLTSDYHMFRAHRAFTRAGLVVAPRPFPDIIKRARGFSRWGLFLGLCLETTKIGYYFARGWI